VKKFSDKRANLAFGISAAAMAIALTVAAPAHAQTASTLRGEGATPGQTITVTDTVTGRSTTVTANDDGSFVIIGLRPSTYRLEGAGEAQEVVIPVGQTVTVDVAAAEAPADGDAIVVTGHRGRSEVRTATIGTNVSPQQMESLPQTQRNFLNFAALAPGVTLSADVNNARIQSGGNSADNINVFIDGTSQKNQVGFGGVAGQNFSGGNPFPQSAIQEFRVETQNFKAEYEQAGSAIITAVTKTGGSSFHGGAFGTYIPKSWYGRPYFDRSGNINNPTGANPKPDYKRQEFGADVSGPIIPNVLHFFAAYEGTRRTNPGINVNSPAGLPASLQPLLVASTAQFKSNLYFGKLTFFASDADTINVSYFRREEEDLRDYGGNRAFENGRNVGTNSENYQLEWNHREDTWLNELTVGRFQNFTGTPTITEGPEYVVTQNNQGGGDLLFFGANSFEQANDQDAWTIRDNFTFTGWNNHVVKAGVRLSFTTLTRIEDAFANGTYRFVAGSFTTLDASTPWSATISILPPTPMEAKNTQLGLFIQDDWQINDHLTINAGLRWDYESNNFNNKFVTPTKVATALRNYQPWKAAGIDAENYINDGTRRSPFKGAFQPRLGISYDVFGDRDLVLFAGAGRYYDRNIFYTASLERLFNTIRSDATVTFCAPGGTTAQQACTGNNGVPGVGQLTWNPAFRDPDALRAAVGATGLSGDIWVINNDARVPYTDQFTAGVRKRLGPVQLSVAVSHNRSHDSFIFVRGNRQTNGNYTDLGDAWIRDPGAMSQDMFVPGYSGRLNIGSSNGEQRYTALFLTAEKTYTKTSGWGFTSALTISNARSNQARAFNEAEMFNAGSQDAYGWNPTNGLERWRFVSTVIGDLPLGFQASGTLTLASGPRFGNVRFDGVKPPMCGGCVYFNESGVLGPKSDIAYKNLDLRLAKTFKLPWGHEVTADVQVFNVFDSVNRTYSTWGAGSGSNPTLEENSTVGYARSFQAGFKYRF
jgi:outer membrane receptor protein involved in Fe transport